MGLLDQVIAGVTGSKSAGSSGTSPLVKALLLLLAAKAVSSHFGKSDTTPAPAGPAPAPSGTIDSGILAGLPSLDSLLDRLKGKGHGDAVQSWIGTGPNRTIDPHALGSALDPQTIAQLEKETGLPRDQLLHQLSDSLPKVVDKLTPDGRLPAPGERAHW